MHIRCYPCSWYRRDFCPHRSQWGKVLPTDRMAASLDLWAWVQEREGVCIYPLFFLSHRKACVTSSSPDSLIHLSQIATTQFDKLVDMSPIPTLQINVCCVLDTTNGYFSKKHYKFLVPQISQPCYTNVLPQLDSDVTEITYLFRCPAFS